MSIKLWIILFFVTFAIAIGVVYIVSRVKGNTSGDIKEALWLTVFGFVLIGFILCIALLVGGVFNRLEESRLNAENWLNNPATIDRVEEVELVSDYTVVGLQDNTGIEGKISGNAGIYYFAISGTVNNVNLYKLMVDKGDWQETITIPATATKVITIASSEPPRLETWHSKVLGRWEGNGDVVVTYKLYVPQSAISADINIDLE